MSAWNQQQTHCTQIHCFDLARSKRGESRQLIAHHDSFDFKGSCSFCSKLTVTVGFHFAATYKTCYATFGWLTLCALYNNDTAVECLTWISVTDKHRNNSNQRSLTNSNKQLAKLTVIVIVLCAVALSLNWSFDFSGRMITILFLWSPLYRKLLRMLCGDFLSYSHWLQLIAKMQIKPKWW